MQRVRGKIRTLRTKKKIKMHEGEGNTKMLEAKRKERTPELRRKIRMSRRGGK